MNLRLNILFIFIFILIELQLSGQMKVSGFVKDKQSGELLIGANIIEEGTLNGTITDNYGHFSIRVDTPCIIIISFVGFNSQTISLTRYTDTLINVLLEPSGNLDPVIIKANRKNHFNTINLSKKDLLLMPSLGGKPDIMRSLQTMPGIQSQNEASSRILVRGGDPGQNLYLLDNVPLIYVHHLGGFSSVFNPEAINNIEVYKSGFPARYGGKLSSVIDVTQREGDKSIRKGSLSMGLTDLSFTVEGPLFKNTSFIITGRKTLTDFLMAGYSYFSKANDYIVSYGFHDINSKLSWRPDMKNTFYLNLYQGDDYLNYWNYNKKDDQESKSRLTNIWGNWMVSARWNHLKSSRMFITNNLSFINYRLKDKRVSVLKEFSKNYYFNSEYLSAVRNVFYQLDFKYLLFKDWSLQTGLQSMFLMYIPNQIKQSNYNQQKVSNLSFGIETALYLDNNIKINKCFEFYPGVRFEYYQMGNYNNLSFEPRLNLIYKLSDNHAFNISYMQVDQYSHILFSQANIMLNEIWVPADKDVLPAISKQYSAGWRGYFFDNLFYVAADVYYKQLDKLVIYKEGYENLLGDQTWKSKITGKGTGETKGAEFTLKKCYGSWDGMINYTYSHATRKYPEINNGEIYLFDYDRPHEISFHLNYGIKENLHFSLLWVYKTGLPYTPVIGRKYRVDPKRIGYGEIEYYETLIYGKRNSERMRDYHRLDISVTYKTTTKHNREAFFTFSIYNLYNRQNPFFYYYNNNNTGEMYEPGPEDISKPLSLYQVSFFPIIPTFSYKVIFNQNTNGNQKTNTKNKKLKNWLYYEN